MRLINTETGLLEDFIGDDVPKYGILSHTWEEDEISLHEFQRLKDPGLAQDPKTIAGKAKSGYIKIQGCIRIAKSKKIPYIWVDTCCIDKTSSADLTESINSMYRWYANSEVCFAYLVDVETDYWKNGRPPWEGSRWFTRGWTLQELIAPREVKFYFKSWKYLSSKQSPSISSITGIQLKVLKSGDLSSICVAETMSWASRRKTTRKEDMAYCLLGLFDTNMALLYGEGDRAFLRLQEHIAASSTDHSIFAWGVMVGSASGIGLRSYRSIFARSPADFSLSVTIEEQIIVHPDAWTQTNRGLHGVFPTIPAFIAKEVFEVPEHIEDDDYLIILNCQSSASSYLTTTSMDDGFAAGIWIRMIDVRDDGKHGFCRVTDTLTFGLLEDIHKLLSTSPKKFREDLWLATTPSILRIPRDHVSKRLAGFLVHTRTIGDTDKVRFKVHGVYGHKIRGRMHIVPCTYLPTTQYEGLIGAVTVEHIMEINGVVYKEIAVVLFGYPSNSTIPFAKIVDPWEDERGVETAWKPSKSLLELAVRKFVKPEDQNRNRHGPWDYKRKIFGIDLYLGTVLHNGMIFTELVIELYPWFYSRNIYREANTS